MKSWLKNAVFYEIYPQSFNDTNADGIGDIKGIIEKLDYIKDLGFTAIGMNPCFDSPFNDAARPIRTALPRGMNNVSKKGPRGCNPLRHISAGHGLTCRRSLPAVG